MSLTASTLVWDHSRASGDALLVLLSLAERANKHHAGISWSKVDTLAARVRLHQRALQRAVAEAVGLGELYVHVVHGRGRMNAYMVTTGRTRVFVIEALVEHLGLPVDVAEEVSRRVVEPAGKGDTGVVYSVGKGDTGDTFSTVENVTRVTGFRPGKGDTGVTLSDRKVTPPSPFTTPKTRQNGSENPTEPAGKGDTGVVPPLDSPMMKNHEEEPVRETRRRRRARMSGPASAPARIDDDDFFELILGEFERQTGRRRKPADEVAARTLRGVAFESARRGIAKSVAGAADGQVSSLRYCLRAISEFERGRIHAGIGAASKPAAVPDPEPDIVGPEQLEVDGAEYSKADKDPVWAEVAKFLARSASMYGRVPDHGEIRAHLILECGFDPGLVAAMYPTGNGSSASSPGQVFTTAAAAKE